MKALSAKRVRCILLSVKSSRARGPLLDAYTTPVDVDYSRIVSHRLYLSPCDRSIAPVAHHIPQSARARTWKYGLVTPS